MAVVTAAMPRREKCYIPASLTASNRKTRRPARSRRILPSGVVRDELGVHPRSLQILCDAMLADVESSEGTGSHRRR